MLSNKNLTEKKLNRMLLFKKSGTLGLIDTSYLILMHDYWHSEVYWPHGGFSSVPHTSCLIPSTLPLHRNLGPRPTYHPSYSSLLFVALIHPLFSLIYAFSSLTMHFSFVMWYAFFAYVGEFSPLCIFLMATIEVVCVLTYTIWPVILLVISLVLWKGNKHLWIIT